MAALKSRVRTMIVTDSAGWCFSVYSASTRKTHKQKDANSSYL